MRARAGDVVPDERLGLFSDTRAFFRSGRPGQWRTVLTEGDLDTCRRLRESPALPDMIAWLAQGTCDGGPARSPDRAPATMPAAE